MLFIAKCDSQKTTLVALLLLLLFSHQVVSNSFWLHEWQHARLLCTSLSPGVSSDPHPLSQWCYVTISSSATLFSFCLQSFTSSESIPLIDSLHQVGKVLELQLQHQSFQWIFRTDFLWDWLIWSPCCPKDSQNSSRAPQSESINSLALSLLYGPGLLPIHNYGKTVALTIQNCSRLKMLFIFIFYWSLSALQRCVGFAVQQHESAICVHISTAS